MESYPCYPLLSEALDLFAIFLSVSHNNITLEAQGTNP